MTVSHWQKTISPRRIVECDVCVIGGGVAGACAALWLSRFAPQLKVAIVEARSIGSGASGRNAGMILAGLSDHYDLMVTQFGREQAREIWNVTLEHQRHLREFLEKSKTVVDFENCGSWRLAFEPDERRNLERSATLLKEDGFDCVYRADDPLKRGFHGALGIEGDAGVHPLRLVRAIVEASGAEVFTDCEVSRIDNVAGDTVRVETNEFDFCAGRVVVALNAYAPLVDENFRWFVAPHRAQVLLTAPLASRIVDRMVYAHHGYIYFRQLRDGRFLLGGWRHAFAADEACYTDDVTTDVQGALERFMHERFPETRDVKVEARWAGIMGFSPDGLPCVGSIHDERVMFAGGFTGHGFGLAFEVMRRAIESLLHGKSAGIFDIGRFKESERKETGADEL